MSVVRHTQSNSKQKVSSQSHLKNKLKYEVDSIHVVRHTQKQPPEVFCKRRCSYKTPVPESLF